MTRGLRNNNPGNIRKSGTKYRGETESNDSAFKAFENMAWGYRAIFVLLYTYQKKRGINTIAGIFPVYAPGADNNDEQAYINAVSKWSGIAPDAKIDTTNKDYMIPIVAAISRMENGIPANMEDVQKGWELFVKHKP